MKPSVVLSCLIAAALALPAHAQQGKARMYKCVDGAGKVYYSDKMNPDCGQSSELNRQGVVMKKKEAAKPRATFAIRPGDELTKPGAEGAAGSRPDGDLYHRGRD